MKFLLLNQAFYPDVVSSGQHLADLALGLVERGHEVTILTGRRGYDDPRRMFAREERWHGVRILRVGGTGLGKQRRWGRVLDFASFLLMSCLRAAFLARPDVVVALTSPPLISFLGLCLARLRRSRFIYWVMDLNPDEAVAAGWIRAGSLTARCLEAISLLSLRGAHRIIVLDRFMFARIRVKGIASAKISLFPPWSHDPEVRFDPSGRERFRKQIGVAKKFVVMYSGNHSPCHPLDTLLQAARALETDDRVLFCFIGGGSEFRRIQEMASPPGLRTKPLCNERFLSNVRCLPYLPRNQLSASLSAADLHVVVMGDPFVGLVHPCKIYNILRIGAPVVYLGPRPSPTSDILACAGPQLHSASLSHGDVEGLIGYIKHVREESPRPSTRSQIALADKFAKDTVLPALIEQLEGTPQRRSRVAPFTGSAAVEAD